jgi:hypothetical protein
MLKLELGRFVVIVEVFANRSLYMRLGKRDWFFGRAC